MENETITNHGCYDTTTSTLTVKETAPPSCLKPLKMIREMKADTGLNIVYDRYSTKPNISEAKVIPCMPDEELANIEDGHKNARNNQQLIRNETKKSTTTEQRRGLRGRDKQHNTIQFISS